MERVKCVGGGNEEKAFLLWRGLVFSPLLSCLAQGVPNQVSRRSRHVYHFSCAQRWCILPLFLFPVHSLRERERIDSLLLLSPPSLFLLTLFVSFCSFHPRSLILCDASAFFLCIWLVWSPNNNPVLFTICVASRMLISRGNRRKRR